MLSRSCRVASACSPPRSPSRRPPSPPTSGCSRTASSTTTTISTSRRRPAVQPGLTPDSVAWAFTTFHGANWFPLTWLSWMLDAELYGLSPRGFHATSLALHIVNMSCSRCSPSRGSRGSLGVGAFTAGVFALHPLHVESVAWAAARKDVLSGCLLDARAARLRALGAARASPAPAPRSSRGSRAGAAREADPGGAAFRAAAARRLAAAPSPSPGQPRLGPGSGSAGAAREVAAVRDRGRSSGRWCSSSQSSGARCAARATSARRCASPTPLVAYATYLRRAWLPTDLTVFYPHPGDVARRAGDRSRWLGRSWSVSAGAHSGSAGADPQLPGRLALVGR